MNNYNKIYIILVNYNGWKDTIECLESLLRNSYPSFQVIVCDNASSDGSLDRIKEWAAGIIISDIYDNNPLKHLTKPFLPKPVNYYEYRYADLIKHKSFQTLSNAPLILIDSGSNLGFAGGNNAGVKFAQLNDDYSAIWFLNNDTVIEKDTLTELAAYSAKYRDSGKKIGMIGSKLLYYDRPDTIQGCGGIYYRSLAYSRHIGTGSIDNGQYDQDDLKMDYIIGASMFVPREFIDDVGLMNEEYFIYFEETDWIVRGRRKNWETGYAWRSKVYHKEGAAIGANKQKRTKSGIAVYYFFRNAIIFTRRYYPLFLLTVIPRIMAILFIRILKRDRDNLRAMILALSGKKFYR